MAVVPVTWHGSQQEYIQLTMAVDHNCQCVGDSGVKCIPHRMLDDEQRVVDHLVFARRLRAKWLEQEGLGEALPE